MWSPVQYLSRACRTSSSKGTFFSKSHSRADAGSTPFSTANRFVHSAAVWLNSRRRARQDRRRYHN